jgi:hypothetical protein
MVSSFKQRTLDGFEDDDDAFDENGILRDGHRARYAMTMMDSGFDDTQRAVARDAHERRVARRFGLSDGSALHRPGFRHNVNDIGLDARIEAHEQYCDELENSWRGPPTGASSSGHRGAQPDDSCTLNGRAGHLRWIDGELKCIADRSILGEDCALSDREAAHAEHRHYLENAWRSPDAGGVADHRPVRRADQMPTRDTVEQAYADHDEWLRNAWRNP